MKISEWIKKIWQLIPAVLLTGVGAALLWAARMVPGFAEWYSRTVYPVLVSDRWFLRYGSDFSCGMVFVCRNCIFDLAYDP